MRVGEVVRQISYVEAYRALSKGDKIACNAMTAFARTVMTMQIDSYIDASQIAQSWSDCTRWASTRRQRKGLALSSEIRKNETAANALAWLSVILAYKE